MMVSGKIEVGKFLKLVNVEGDMRQEPEKEPPNFFEIDSEQGRKPIGENYSDDNDLTSFQNIFHSSKMSRVKFI